MRMMDETDEEEEQMLRKVQILTKHRTGFSHS